MSKMSDLERRVLVDVMKQYSDYADVIEQQAAVLEVVERSKTDFGIVTSTSIGSTAPALHISDQALGKKVYTVDGMDLGVGAFVMIRKGYIDFIELYSFDEKIVYPLTLM